MAGRPKSFDRDDALAAASGCFWEKGFEGCAVRDLEAATGLGRQSLYNEFGDKRRLYLAALGYYVEHNQRSTLSALEGEGAPLDQVEALIRGAGAYAAREGCRGCLVVNAAAEADGSDPELAAVLHASVRRQDQAIAEALGRAVRAGDLPKDYPIDATARTLSAVMQGLALRGRLGSPPEELDAVVEGAVRLLRK